MYDKKFQEYEDKQADLATKMLKFQVADKEFYATINMLISLAQRAEEIFESSEPHEKRTFANFLLQNCQLDGKKLNFELKTPFDGALSAYECSNLLALANDFSKLDWSKAFKYPEVTLSQMKQLLQPVAFAERL